MPRCAPASFNEDYVAAARDMNPYFVGRPTENAHLWMKLQAEYSERKTIRGTAQVIRHQINWHWRDRITSMDYDENSILTRYIWDHYHHLMTELEQQAGSAIIGRLKADDSTNPQTAKKLREDWGRTNDPTINALLQDGTATFRRRVRDRLLQTYPEQIFINRCPACQRIVRTPKARLCVWCGHTWYEQDAS
jgi:hypothetical protein